MLLVQLVVVSPSLEAFGDVGTGAKPRTCWRHPNLHIPRAALSEGRTDWLIGEREDDSKVVFCVWKVVKMQDFKSIDTGYLMYLDSYFLYGFLKFSILMVGSWGYNPDDPTCPSDSFVSHGESVPLSAELTDLRSLLCASPYWAYHTALYYLELCFLASSFFGSWFLVQSCASSFPLTCSGREASMSFRQDMNKSQWIHNFWNVCVISRSTRYLCKFPRQPAMEQMYDSDEERPTNHEALS